MRRRHLLLGCCALTLPRRAASAPAPDVPETHEHHEQRLTNRLELWANYASRTENLVARYTLLRRSSLLDTPLQTTGTLVFINPDRLVLRDDDLTGSMTEVRSGRVSILPLRPGSKALEIQAARRPAVEWLRDRILRVFAPGDGASLVEGCRAHVPNRRGYLLDLMPERDSVVRKTIRSMTLTLDPVAGAVTRIHLSEAQGDVVELSLADHRQNVDAPGLAQALGEREPVPSGGETTPEP